ncbi:ATP-binding domain-containing protein [Mesorhizobium sp.]|uniref:DEAD/DEAH box helicase n=1 Tax=Mesorhizobium sp. TaxID=1871066 RepID=UPI0012255BDD|nr:ATP-binding domain-containing protein [Mesorhizobium sp.]TIL42327.1 MAG: hypothetical protein E5Y86_27895 [Mesorhizobium sp.]
MALDVLITTNRIAGDPAGRLFVDHLKKRAGALGLDDAALYYDFPAYADYETVAHKPDALVVSPSHGILAIKFVKNDDTEIPNTVIESLDESLTQFCSILIGRLLKSKPLRDGMSSLIFPILPILYFTKKPPVGLELECETVTSLTGFEDILASQKRSPIPPAASAETRSVIEGAKALSRPKPRHIENPEIQRPAAALLQLELDIANFDQRQRRAALVNIDGPQRIRGLAGSGKTIILAMKAAHLHLNKPSDRILVTFYTRSLYASLKGLITRFFRNFKDEDPDWSKIHIRHGWGGSSRAGTYADACVKHGIAPLTFLEAQKGALYMRAKNGFAGERIDPFDYACRDLLSRVSIRPQYDHILIDEGQDFPSGFYELCFGLAKGDRDKKSIVWAYDELQNILDIKIRTPDQLFGVDSDGQPRISLPRAGSALPFDADNDTILRKCYRNQREVLVTAHAVGFGIYKNIVQMLESREHWEDVGYDVVTPGPLVVGKKVVISRPAANSPLSLSTDRVPPTIDCHVALTFEHEGRWIAEQVSGFINGGLQPEDILIISLDDKAAKSYFRKVSSLLSEAGIASNNITADPYNEPPFTLPGKVTLSTVYRAKGNEAAVVFAAGVDAVVISSRSGRNKLFTAFTRTKAWLRVSGVGENAQQVCQEIGTALANFPNLSFVMPNLKQVDTIQRDLNQRSIVAKRIREEYLSRLQAEGFEIDEAADLLSLENPDE